MYPMSDDWNKNKFAGNSAENIFEFLIGSLPDWKCNKFGVETHIKDIQKMVSKIVNPITTKIRCMPDFVVFNEKTEETFLIEVKFRSENYFKYLENYNEHWEGTKLVLIHKDEPYFEWVDLEKINPSMKKFVEIKGEKRFIWDFGGLQKNIKTLFPDLTDETIIDAIKRVPQAH